MRLIDADKLLDLIKDQKEKETGAYTKGINKGLNIVKSIICDEAQTPTAYDVDAVVKQLEEWTFNADVNIGDETMMNHDLMVSKNAIEIVKGGGVDAKTDS